MISTAFASSHCTNTEIGVCIPHDPLGFVTSVYGAALGLIGGVGLLFIVYGGFLILSSQGNPAQLQKGRSYITYAILGIVLALSGFTFYQIVAKDILQIPGFTN